MMRPLLFMLSAFCGLISLSYEILWVRLVSYATASSAYTFPMTLGLFLLGIALGARLSKRISKRHQTHDPDQLKALAGFMFLSNLVGWLVVPLLAQFYALPVALPPFMGLYLVAAGAVLLGAQFPLLTHYGIEPDQRSGANLSYFYMSNIVGSVVGSLVTGFVLLDRFSLVTVLTGLACLGTVMSLALYLVGRPDARQRAMSVGVCAVTLAALILGQNLVFGRLYEKLFYKAEHASHPAFKLNVENKSGVINVTQDDIVYGGGVYDGHFSTDLHHDVNNIRRPMTVSAFHPAPKKILVIGLATGSWAKVAAAHPQAQRLVLIEINPGYVQVIERYPSHSPLLRDPRVELVIDDGRRWLHTTRERFDVVLLNTTFHWRSMSTGLLSEEFFALVKDHLEPNGVVMVNSTGSDRVFTTMLKVFPDGYRYLNNGIASPSRIDYDLKRLEAIWDKYTLDGKPVFDPSNAEHMTTRANLLESLKPCGLELPVEQTGDCDLEDAAALRRRLGHLRTITDRNMGDEFSLRRNLLSGAGQ